MKNLITMLAGVALLLALFSPQYADAQIWTWMDGSGASNQFGTYGTQGVAASTNIPGGRIGAVTWTDGSGNFWLFGGKGLSENSSGRLNDLWKFNPASGEWTWMKGSKLTDQSGVYGIKSIPGGANAPGAREGAISWIDASGNLWLFGGEGYGDGYSGKLNDLWKFNPTTSQWTWMSGSKTIAAYDGITTPTEPCGRKYASSWRDGSGNLWLFGGYGTFTTTWGYLNDLWKYSPVSGAWTMVAGSVLPNQAGNYGTKGTAAVANNPAARERAVSWIDASGVFYLFGGRCITSGKRNDLWRFDPTTGMWTWIHGDNTLNSYGTYGTYGVSAAANTPGARYGAVGWKDNTGDLWLFGGAGFGSWSQGWLNDLWKYNPSTNEWAWVKGSNSPNAVGVYGTKGVSSVTNMPGARDHSATWVDNAGNLWLFGAYLSAAYSYYANDLWRCSPIPPLCATAGPANQVVTLGYMTTAASVIVSVTGGLPPYTYSWSTNENTQQITVLPSVSTTYTVTVTDAANQTATATVDVEVLDWRCGNNLNKVILCHNGHTICVAPDAVQAHLEHGDQLGGCTAPKHGTSAPAHLMLSQNYPNPFNPSTIIEYAIPQDGIVRLVVCDQLGREIRVLAERLVNAGTHRAEFNGANLPSGIYLYRLEWEGASLIRRMTLLK